MHRHYSIHQQINKSTNQSWVFAKKSYQSLPEHLQLHLLLLLLHYIYHLKFAFQLLLLLHHVLVEQFVILLLESQNLWKFLNSSISQLKRQLVKLF